MVLLVKQIKYYYPRLVDLHNYPSITKKKIIIWITLNKNVQKIIK